MSEDKFRRGRRIFHGLPADRVIHAWEIMQDTIAIVRQRYGDFFGVPRSHPIFCSEWSGQGERLGT